MSEENKKDYQENIDTLITFGDEGHTMRKDDPRTKKLKKKLEKEKADKIASGEESLWEGIDLSNKRGENEEYENYRERLKVIKNLQILYKRLGIEECRKQFPMGFAYAINQSMKDGGDKITSKPAPKMAATIEGKEIPVTIKNSDDETK